MGSAGASVKVTSSDYLCTEDEELCYWQLQKRCIAMDKTLLGYQGHVNNEETVINPKDKEVPRFWGGVGKDRKISTQFCCGLLGLWVVD